MLLIYKKLRNILRRSSEFGKLNRQGCLNLLLFSDILVVFFLFIFLKMNKLKNTQIRDLFLFL